MPEFFCKIDLTLYLLNIFANLLLTNLEMLLVKIIVCAEIINFYAKLNY